MAVGSYRYLPWLQNTTPDPKMRPYKEPISAELREKLIVGVAAWVTRIYRHCKAQQTNENQLYGDTTTYRRVMPKIGRNDPCPCGSKKIQTVLCQDHPALNLRDRSSLDRGT